MRNSIFRIDTLVLAEEIVSSFNLQLFGDFDIISCFFNEVIAGAIVFELTGMVWHEDGRSFHDHCVLDLIIIEGERWPFSFPHVLVI